MVPDECRPVLSEPPSPELAALARQVVAAQAARAGEDIQAWADKLAKDVGEATD